MEMDREQDALDELLARTEKASMEELPNGLTAEIFSKIKTEPRKTLSGMLYQRLIMKPKTAVAETMTSIKNELLPAKEALELALAVMKAI